MTVKPYLLFAIKISLTTALCAYIIPSIKFSEFFILFNSAKLSIFFASILLILLQCFIAALRWHCILLALGLGQPMRTSLRVFWSSMFFNLFLPGGISGDIYRALKIQRNGASLSKGISSILLDRIWATSTLVFMILSTVYNVKNIFIPVGFIFNLRTLIITTVLGLALLVFLVYIIQLYLKSSRSRVAKLIQQLLSDIKSLLTSPTRAIIITLISVACMLTQIFCIYTLAQSLNIPLSFVLCLTIVPSILFLSALPVSIAGWGIRESMMVFLLGRIGITTESALSISILYGTFLLLMNMSGGVIWLLSKKGKNSIKPLSLLIKAITYE